MPVLTSPVGGGSSVVCAAGRSVTWAAVSLAAQRAASRHLRDGASLLRLMRIMNVQAVFSYTVDSVEHARRKRAGGGAVMSPDVLDLLLGLPVGVPVPVVGLTDRERGALRTAPRWAVQILDDHAVRLAVAPVSVDLALVAARGWRSGLDLAGRFAPFCTRAMVLGAYPLDDQEMRLEADFYGVGVTVAQDKRVDVLVSPTPFRLLRLTAAGWRFLERVYEQHLQAKDVSAPEAVAGPRPAA